MSREMEERLRGCGGEQRVDGALGRLVELRLRILLREVEGERVLLFFSRRHATATFVCFRPGEYQCELSPGEYLPTCAQISSHGAWRCGPKSFQTGSHAAASYGNALRSARRGSAARVLGRAAAAP